tara:strand:+ start:30933 stop:31700 length:768 start_codon:yes stop_codon:yes gene_type:complete
MSAPLQRLPECTLAAIVATAVVFALNTAPTGQGLRAATASSDSLASGVVLSPNTDGHADEEGFAVIGLSDGDLAGTLRTSGDDADSSSQSGSNPEELGTDAGDRNRAVMSELKFEDGTLEARGPSRNGQRFGHWLLYRENGVGVLAEGSYIDDMRDGLWTRYHENGQIESQGEYAEDLREGPWEHFTDLGILIITEQYTGGLRDGLWRRTYSDGSIREEGYYARGRRVGQWVFQMPDGMPTRQGGFYVNGVKVSD